MILRLFSFPLSSTIPDRIHGESKSNPGGSAMKRIVRLVVLSIAAVIVLVGCGGGGGGGGIGTNANATPPSVLNAGVPKSVVIYSGASSQIAAFGNSAPPFTGEVTVSGNIISLTGDANYGGNGKNHVYVGMMMAVDER